MEPRRLLAAADLLPVLGNGVLQPPVHFPVSQVDSYPSGARTFAMPDGRVVHAILGGQVFIFRFLLDGRGDDTFAEQGTLYFKQNGLFVHDVTMSPDGRLFLAGTLDNQLATIVAIAANGELDQSFGINGIATFDVAGETARGTSIAIAPSGVLYMATDDVFQPEYGQGPSICSILRVRADGTLDAGFGAGGRAVISPLHQKGASVRKLLVQPDGKILAAGSVGGLFQSNPFGVSGGFLAYRVTPAGTLDTRFGKAGIYAAFRDGEFEEQFNDAAIDSAGNIFLAGGVREGGAIVKLSPRGVLDQSFSNTRGVRVVNTGDAYYTSLNTVQIDRAGRVLVAGSGTVARFVRNGTPDESFAPGGVKTFGVFAEESRPDSAVELPDGRIVLMADSYSILFSASATGPMRQLRGSYAAPEESGLLPNGLLRLNLGQDAGSVTTRIVNGKYRVIRNGVTSNYPLSAVTGVYVIGSPGDDRIELAPGGPQAVIEGRAGNDTIYATNAADSISGGDGDDFIRSLGGRDTVRTDAGNDSLDYSTDITGVIVRGLAIDRRSAPDSLQQNDRLYDDFERVIGSEFDDEIRLGTNGRYADGSAGDDSIRGSAGNDSIFAGSGFDTVEGGDGNDFIDGGSGNDILRSGVPDAATGGARQSTIFGQGGDDFIELFSSGLADGGSGNDTLSAAAYFYEASANADTTTTLLGQAGDDTIMPGRKRSIASGGSGINRVSFERRRDNLRISADGIANDGATGDRINIGTDFDHFTGGAGNDVIFGTTRDNNISSNGGEDTIYGYAGRDVIHGGALVYAGEGDDSVQDVRKVYGGTGNDSLTGTSVYGEAGDDTLYALYQYYSSGPFEPGPFAMLDGAEGNDTLTAGNGSGRASGGAGDDLFYAVRDDLVVVPPPPQRGWTFDGGAGIDTMSYESRYRSLYITIDGIANDGNRNELDNVLPGFETIIAGSGFDQITGSGRDEHIFGKSGGDVIRGGGGNDFIDAGGGNDRVYGDGGSDTLVGGNGNDTLFGGNGIDSLTGGTGDDLLDGIVEVDP